MKDLLESLERSRDSRVLLLAASHMELDLLPPLHDALCEIGHAPRLDVLLHCSGGMVNAARRVALLLHQATDRLAVIVPERCESSAMLAALPAREIVAGPAAVFTPFDPRVEGGSPGPGSPAGISAQDVRLFARMVEDWFGFAEADAKARALAALCESIFPTTLTCLYRSALEAEAIGAELIALGLPATAPEIRAGMVTGLLYGHHSHGFALTREDLLAIGLPVRRDDEAEAISWEIARMLRGTFGSGVPRRSDDDWCDAVIATAAGCRRRWRSAAEPAPVWRVEEAG